MAWVFRPYCDYSALNLEKAKYPSFNVTHVAAEDKPKDGNVISDVLESLPFEDISDVDLSLGKGQFLQNRLDGKRRSVLIGINYVGQSGELRGCINDVLRIKEWLPANGFADDHEQHILTDEPEGPYAGQSNVTHLQPTKENIIKSLCWLVDNSERGDSLFFHFSGHGVRVPDQVGDEHDGMDESLVPVDYRTNGVIIDDILNAILVKQLRRGVRLTCVMDCCHSGSALDLPFSFDATDEAHTTAAEKGELNLRKNPALGKKLERAQETVATKISVSAGGVVTNAREQKAKMFKTAQEVIESCPDEDERKFLERVFGECLTSSVREAIDPLGTKLEGGEVVKFSGCQDVQTASDVSSTRNFDLPEVLETDANLAGGACTSAFLGATMKDEKDSYIRVLETMRKDLSSKGFKQIPQLSSTMAFDLHSIFDLRKDS